MSCCVQVWVLGQVRMSCATQLDVTNIRPLVHSLDCVWLAFSRSQDNLSAPCVSLPLTLRCSFGAGGVTASMQAAPTNNQA